MPKYLAQASYSVDGAKGLIQAGGSSRIEAAKSIVEAMGGTLESMYFSFGQHDAVMIADFPDNVSAAAVSLAVNASGATTAHITPLLTPAELDAAAQKVPNYTPPGG